MNREGGSVSSVSECLSLSAGATGSSSTAASSAGATGGVVRADLGGGGGAAAGSSSSAGSQMDCLLTRHHFHQELERSQNQTIKEEHNKRIKNLRKDLLEHLTATEWQYTPIDQLIGP